MRSMSPTEMVTLPAMTAPLSSTRLMRSASSSGALSMALRGIVILPGEMIRRPWPGELETEPTSVVIANQRRHRCAELIEVTMRDEKRRIEHSRSSLIGGRLRHRIVRRVECTRGQLVVGGGRNDVRNTVELVLASGVELSTEQVRLP